MGVDFDVVTFGECMIRFSPSEHQMLEQADQLRGDPAGTESNMAVALARLGVRVSWFSALPALPVGRWIVSRLNAHGVDTSQTLWTEDRAGVFFLEAGYPPRGSRVVYDRKHAAISRLNPEAVPWDRLTETKILHTTGITAALSATGCDLVRRGLEAAKEKGRRTSFDINYRARLWSPEEAARTLAPLLENVDILISTEADIRLLFHIPGTPEQIIQTLWSRFGASIIVLTLAEGGAVGWSEDGDFFRTGPHSVERVDRLGAGDAFDAGFLYGVLKEDLPMGLRLGAALAAIAYSEQGDMTWTTREEAQRLAGYESL